ncbi:ABC transporter permease [Pararhizobium sp. DWP3-4]|uniref:ABC transporter permease n=1 Tax=Pararhizobium sp. DWP3-4 TaxID=2804565 RepID=UPI003CF63B53
MSTNRNAFAEFVSDARYIASTNKLTFAAGLILLGLVVIAVIAPVIAPYDPIATDAAKTLLPPSLSHPFGTDALGRDILSRVIYATRLDLGIAVGAVAVSFAIGLALGSVAGYAGGWTDAIIGRFMDTIMAFPLFVLAMGIVAALGNNVFNIMVATAIINLPFYTRFARAEVSVLSKLTYVEAARMGGNGPARVLAAHIAPNILPKMVVQASLNLGWAILNAAGLSFIGLGVRPPTPEWGIMVSEGAQYIFSGEWWTFVFPGLALVIAVFCFNLVGDGLRDLIDPRART